MSYIVKVSDRKTGQLVVASPPVSRKVANSFAQYYNATMTDLFCHVHTEA